MKLLVVVQNRDEWNLSLPEVELVSARDYLTEGRYSDLRNVRLFNLCRSYKYQSSGYYVSLLAAARGHKPMPDVSALIDLKLPTMIRHYSDDLYELIQKSLSTIQSDSFVLSIYFGRNLAKRYDRLSDRLFRMFQSPLLRARFERRGDEWELKAAAPISASEILPEHREFVEATARDYFAVRMHRAQRRKKVPRYNLAILVNPSERFPPSDAKAIARFIRAGETLGIEAETIEKEDFGRLAGFDALFIRETTNVNHHTYRFARRAQAEGLVVIDDPDSILRCTNKVYLAELLARHRIRMPTSLIAHKYNWQTIPEKLGLPAILKTPDSSFSQGVMKVTTIDELREAVERILSRSDLFIAQEFLPSEYDWRVGVLNRKPLYLCRYYMARGHWQIQGVNQKGETTYGDTASLSLDEAPAAVISDAVKAANLIGNGLYGVDMKFVNGKSYVIEVNDNPSIEAGIEDGLLKEELYLEIMRHFLDRLQRRVAGSVVQTVHYSRTKETDL